MSEINKTIPFFKPSFSNNEYQAVQRVLNSGWLTSGVEALAFEKEFAEYVGCKHALTVNSASSGLILALEAVGVTKGTKIITTPYTFASTATSAIHLGADILYADVMPDSYLIDPEKIETLLKKDKSVKAIIPVHIAGEVCNMKDIRTLADQYSVAVIEDAAHAFPSRTATGFAGTLGNIGVFSFYATKTITTGEGGMVCTNDDALANRIRLMRSHGIDRPIWDRYTNQKASWEYDLVVAGYKFNLPDILAALGREQLKKAESFFKARKKLALRFNKAFAKLPLFSVPKDGIGHAWHLYLLRLNLEQCRITRAEFGQALQKDGLGISVHFIPHNYFSFFKDRYNLLPSDFPNAVTQFERTVSLPLWPAMSEDDANYVIDIVTKHGKNFLV